MLIKTPTLGDLAYEIELVPDEVPQGPMVYDTPPNRPTEVLGPDGEPVRMELPRRQMGFDLTGSTAKATGKEG